MLRPPLPDPFHSRGTDLLFTPADDAGRRLEGRRLEGRRLARPMAVGVVAAMVAALPYRLFELDRFFVPKEAVLLLTAVVVCWRLAGVTGRADGGDASGTPLERGIDLALAAYLAASAASAVFAPSGWLALRALAISLAGAALFWGARAAARRGAAGTVLTALVVAVAAAAASALLQAYGVRSDYFSINRAPGGTFGNRNFVAHLCAVGLPLAAYAAVRAPRFVPALGAVLTTLALGAMLVLSRSRGAWLAGVAAAAPLAIGVLRATVLARRAAAAAGRVTSPEAGRTWWRLRAGRVLLLVVAVGGGAFAALRLPNTLDWRSESPYLDSVKGMVDYREGSGRGRLAQWRHSAQLVAEDPLLGVGPGNWPVRYPAVAPAGDPSVTAEGTTANPWPSSDWVAVASERGVMGVVALGAVMAGLLLVAHRGVWGRASSTEGVAERALAGGALGGVVAATVVAGAFDAVLLLAAPTIVVWPALGALSALAGDEPSRSAEAPGASAARRRRGAAVLARGGALVLALGAGIAAARGAAMPFYEDGGVAGAQLAARLAPADYRVQLRAATFALGRGDCRDARARAEAAHTMAPGAGAPRRVLATCGRRGGR